MNFDDAGHRLVELAASRHNAIHTSEAADIGFSARRLRRARSRGELTNLRPSVWAHVSLPSSSHQKLRSTVLELQNSAAGYRSAAWLHGWIDQPPTTPEVWVPPTSRARLPAVSIHRFRRIDPLLDIVEIEHIRCLSKAATLCLLGAAADRALLERCLDHFTRAESPEWLERTLERLWTPKAPGPRDLVALLTDPARSHGVSESWFETVVARLVALPWLPPVELQHDVTFDGHRYRIDIAIPALRLGVEAHSRSFHWGPRKVDADNVRDLHLSAAGWQLLYVTWSQIQDPDEFVRLFAAAARGRLGRSEPTTFCR